jgi:hypothetical protein
MLPDLYDVYLVKRDLYDEYPVKLDLCMYNGIYKRFVKSIRNSNWVEFELTNQYRAVPGKGCLRFKTETDMTFFLLKFS